ncbi:DUF4139 domain-containing protein [Myxococcota bacterium]|nr:DUF4139 domain-containing protein [Myxococcota bacterium]
MGLDERLPVETWIAAVTVYREGARVRRVGEVPAAATDELRVQGLPLCLDDGSVTARLEGPGAPRVTGVRVGLQVSDRALPERPEQAAVDAAHAAERRARDRVERFRARIRAAQELASPPRAPGKEGERPPAVPTAARLALLAFRQAELDRAYDALHPAEEALRLATLERQAVEDRLFRATTARAPRAEELRKQAVLALVGGEGPGPWRLHLEYQVPGARWTPAYTLRLSPDLAHGRLELRASVAQRTGEDWAGVALEVNTALPLRWTDLPELPALRFGRRQPTPPRSGWRAPPTGTDGLFADYDRAAALLPSPPVARVQAPDVRPSPPPPPAAPPPSPQPVGAPAPAPPGASAPAPLGASALAPAPARDEAPVARKSRAAAFRRADRVEAEESLDDGFAPPPAMSAAPGGGAPPPPPADLPPDASLLDYGRLRLAGPDAAPSAGRGQLAPADALVLWREQLHVQVQVRIDQELLVLVRGATDRARLSDLRLPPGHEAPAPWRDHDHAWRAEHPLDVPSDGAWHSLSLRHGEAPARRAFVVVPREAREVFRFVELDNPLDGPLPAGPVDVFAGGELLLTAGLRPVDRGGRLRLGLGVEQGIKVARNSRFSERSTGLLGQGLGLDHEVEIQLQSHLAGPAPVEVRERLPVTRAAEDEVKLSGVKADPPWEAWVQEERPVRGTHRWMVELPPGGQRTLSLRYTIELPAKKELLGGNRREG